VSAVERLLWNACHVTKDQSSLTSQAPAEAGGVVAGFFSFTEITDPTAHRAYNEWHQLDHLPEQMPLSGIAHGQRWVLTPRCAKARHAADAELAAAHYMTLYLMNPPLDESIRDFFDLANDLRKKDRFFGDRRAIVSGAIPVVNATASERVRISPAAVPFRPNRGVYVSMWEPATSDGEAFSISTGELLQLPGVTGVWSFRTGLGVDRNAQKEKPGRLASNLDVCYLDQDPLSVSDAISSVMKPKWDVAGVMPRFAGPLETIVPWSWDWFEKE
jgi:hypothetical protein